MAGALGGALTEALGVTEDNFDNLALLVTLCNLSTLLPLGFLFLLDEVVDQPADARVLADTANNSDGGGGDHEHDR